MSIGYIQPISILHSNHDKKEINKNINNEQTVLSDILINDSNNLNEKFITTLDNINRSKFSSFSFSELYMIYQLLKKAETSIEEFNFPSLQVDFVSRVKAAKSSYREYFQIHAFALNLSVLCYFINGNMHIIDIIDISEKGLERLAKVYDLSALDQLQTRINVECGYFIEPNDIDHRIKNLINLICKSGIKAIIFDLKIKSSRQLGIILTKNQCYQDDDFFQLLFFK